MICRGISMKKSFFSITRKKFIWWLSAILSFVFFLILNGTVLHMAGKLQTQTVAERWSPEGDAAQVSCFFSTNAAVTEDQLITFEHELDSALEEASITQDSPNAGARLWADAYSGEGQISLSSDSASITVDAIGVGGDFFLFHPLRLLSGSYFSGSDLMQDHIILDEDAAWQLFGSNDIAGMTVDIQGIPHVISGVVKRDTGSFAEAAGLDGSVAYVSYETLSTLGSCSGINHYELVMPNPVSGYAYNYVTEAIGVSEKELAVLENSSRYSLLNRLKIIAAFGTRSMNGKAIIYPYWENIARGYEDVFALLTLFAVFFLAYTVIFFLVQLILYWKRKTWTVKSVWLRVKDRLERLMESRREKHRKSNR